MSTIPRDLHELHHAITIMPYARVNGETARLSRLRYCYLEDQLSFPFKARVRKTMDASPLKSGENVTVIALAHDQL